MKRMLICLMVLVLLAPCAAKAYNDESALIQNEVFYWFTDEELLSMRNELIPMFDREEEFIKVNMHYLSDMWPSSNRDPNDPRYPSWRRQMDKLEEELQTTKRQRIYVSARMVLILQQKLEQLKQAEAEGLARKEPGSAIDMQTEWMYWQQRYAELAGSARAVQGYSSVVVVHPTLRSDGSIDQLSVYAPGEDPAYAKACTEYGFLRQFMGRKGPFGDADAAAGATVTSQAVISALNSLFTQEEGADKR